MQIKTVERKKTGPAFEFVRWSYDSSVKRSVPTVIGRMDANAHEIPADVLAQATPDERDELSHWWTATLAGRRLALKRGAVMLAPGWLDDVIDGVAGGGLQNPAQAEAIWSRLEALQSALRKAGHPRPKKPSRAAPAAATPIEEAISKSPAK